MNTLLILTIGLPLIGALILMFVSQSKTDQARSIALIFTVLPLVLAVTLYNGLDKVSGLIQYSVHKDWISVPNAFMNHDLHIGFDLGVDGLSMPLVLMTGIISVLAVIASWKVQHRIKEYFIWLLLLVTGLYGVFIAQDLFLFFLFLELTLVPMYFLIGIWGGDRRQRVATKFLIYRGISSVGLLLSFIALAFAAAAVSGDMTTNISTITEMIKKATPNQISLSFRHWVFLLLFLSILIEEAFVPFHTWLTDTHEQSNAAVSMIVGGVLIKIGAYIMLRIGVGVLPDQIQHYATLVAAVGVISVVYGGLVAVVQKDWRRLVAFSSISHMGIMLIGVASMTAAGLQGALFMTVSSGLLSGLLFFLLGAQQQRTHTFEISKLGGLSKPMPVISGFLLVAALGSLGLPGTSGFVSEILSFTGSFGAFPILSAIGTSGMILAAVYLLWAMQRTTYGPVLATMDGGPDAQAAEYVPMVILLGLVILLGVYPSLLGDLFNPTLQQLLTGIGG